MRCRYSTPRSQEMPDCIGPPYSHEPMRQALPRHSASRQVGTHQLTLGAVELQNTTTEKSLSLPPFVFMRPCVSRGVRQALPRHSASRQVDTHQLTLGALELQNTNTGKSSSSSPFVFMSPLRQQGGASVTSTPFRIAPG